MSTALTVLDAEHYQSFVENQPALVLLFKNNPSLFPESHDLAIILPELLKVFNGQLQGAIIASSLERELQAKFRFTSWPTLVFLRHGGYLGAITGIKDWAVYIQEATRLLSLDISEPPAFDLNKVCGQSQPV